MIYKRKKSKIKIALALLVPVLLLLIIFRVELKDYVFGDKLKVLSIKESVFFIESDSKSSNLEKLSTIDENKGIMIFTMANSSVNIEDISKKFSGELLIGRIKREGEVFDGYSSDKNMVGIVAKDTKVEILTHYDSSWYYVKEVESEKTFWVSEDILSFPYTPKVNSDILTD